MAGKRSVFLVALGLSAICVSQPGGGTPTGVKPFEKEEAGSYGDLTFMAFVSGDVTHVYQHGDDDLISGGMNTVAVSNFYVYETSHYGMETQLLYFEMKIGEIEIEKYAPSDSGAAMLYEIYRPVRFASYKFPSGQAITIEITAVFSVHRTDIIGAPWSAPITITASTTVKTHNVGLNWQTTVDATGSYEDDYADQAQVTGNNWQGQMSGMNHQARMPNPTSASVSGILSEVQATTFFTPTTHGLTNGIEASNGDDISWAAITAARAAGITAGFPPANMALLMACYSMEMQDIKWSAQFAWFGTEGLLYSRGITAVNNEDGTNWLGNAPLLPVSEVYILAMEAIAAGEFAISIPVAAEKEGKGTTPVRYLAGLTPRATFFEVISLKLEGEEYQRFKFVFLKENERLSTIDGGQQIWYLVEDMSHLRGE